jgi:CarboxypepD_reg-like domain
MNRNVSLSISKPCSEKFGEFQKTSTGGFCNLCQKEVVDFTNMSDGEILQYFKNGQKNTCGRFRESQLKTYPEVIPSKKKLNFNLLGAGLISFSLVSLLSTTNSYAQHSEQSTIMQKTQKENSKQQNANFQANNNEHIVEGIVIGEDKMPISGVAVVLKGSMIGVSTDINGKFRFPQPLKEGNVLIFSFVGFISQEIIISKKALDTLHITLKDDYCSLMGEVSTDEIYSSKRSFWQKVKRIFR